MEEIIKTPKQVKRTEYNKKYYNKHKSRILTEANEKHICICGAQYTHHHKARHEKSQKHITFINAQ
jgi:hypothetical protein